MAHSGAVSLADLCTICHINYPKYRCPRCSARTCSLPCAKRHKLWSACSGVRDAAAYLKKRQLETPSAFDRDFNFITSIERYIERGDRDAENRGIVLEPAANGRKGNRCSNPVRGAVGLQRRMEIGGVSVVKAPKGMSRDKQNMSRRHKKHKCLNWTVEWILPDGEKMITQCLERLMIEKAYSQIALKRDRTSDRRKRRKADTPAQPSDTPEGAPALHFYLHRPQTSSRCPVLIPISPSETLAEVLRGRVVLEFPTLYVLLKGPDELPRGLFTLEDEYLKECGVEEPLESRSEGEVTDEDEDEDTGAEGATDAARRVNEENVVEALLKDMAGQG